MRRQLLWGMIATTSVAALACAASWKPADAPDLQAARSGEVLDARTRLPVAGAHVVARWLAQEATADGVVSGRCLYRVVTRTDARGRYEVPDTRAQFAFPPGGSAGESRSYWREVHAWAPGAGERSSADDGTLLLGSESAPTREHLQGLRDALAHFTCSARFPGAPPIAAEVRAEVRAAACMAPAGSESELQEIGAAFGTLDEAVRCPARQALNTAP